MRHFSSVTITRTAAALAGAAMLFASAACSASAERNDAAGRDIPLPMDGRWVDARVPANATLEALLRGHGLPADTVSALLTAVTGVFNPKGLRANQAYRITHTLDGIFREFRYEIDQDRLLRVMSRPGEPALRAEVITLPKEFTLEAITLEIEKGGSLVGALEARGENVLLALELAGIYGGEVDFNSDLQPGDRLEVLFERATRHGQFIGYGAVKVAILQNDGRRIHAVAFDSGDGKPAFFDENGRSLKRQFLKSPLPFDPRITSRFSHRRLHPVHGTYRAHLGVDYGAPTGTRVLTVADGVVDFVGWQGEAGRMVRVRHAGGYQTAYLHLSAFAPGIRQGLRVSQGDEIGRVGSSGTATGPHLDYRILKNNVYVDPVAELKKMPKGDPIDASQAAAFGLTRDDMLERMRTLLAQAPARPVPPSSSR